jgi:hypothetical protein
MVKACSTGQQSNIQSCDQKTRREQTFGRFKCRWEDNIKVHLKKKGARGCGLDSFGLRIGTNCGFL